MGCTTSSTTGSKLPSIKEIGKGRQNTEAPIQQPKPQVETQVAPTQVEVRETLESINLQIIYVTNAIDKIDLRLRILSDEKDSLEFDLQYGIDNELDEYSINNVAKDIIGVKTELQENQIQMNNLKQTLQELKTKQIRIQNGEIVMQAQQVAGRDNYYDNSNVMANMAVQGQNEERKQAEGRQIVNSIQNDQNQAANDLIAQMRAKKQGQQINNNNQNQNNKQMNKDPPNDQNIRYYPDLNPQVFHPDYQNPNTGHNAVAAHNNGNQNQININIEVNHQ